MVVGGLWLVLMLVYLAGIGFVVSLAWRLTKAVERIASALEQRTRVER